MAALKIDVVSFCKAFGEANLVRPKAKAGWAPSEPAINNFEPRRQHMFNGFAARDRRCRVLGRASCQHNQMALCAMRCDCRTAFGCNVLHNILLIPKLTLGTQVTFLFTSELLT